MSGIVGVVIVSHSPKVAEGAADMVRQMVGDEVPCAWTGTSTSSMVLAPTSDLPRFLTLSTPSANASAGDLPAFTPLPIPINRDP